MVRSPDGKPASGPRSHFISLRGGREKEMLLAAAQFGISRSPRSCH